MSAAPCEGESLLAANEAHQTTSYTVENLDMSLSSCWDCGNTTADLVPLFFIALFITALLRTFHRRVPILTLGLTPARGPR